MAAKKSAPKKPAANARAAKKPAVIAPAAKKPAADAVPARNAPSRANAAPIASIATDRAVALALAPYDRGGRAGWMLTSRHAPLAPAELIALLDHPTVTARGVTRVELVRDRTVGGNDVPFTDADLERLASMPALAGLRELHVERARIGRRGAAALAASPHASGIEHLSFDQLPIGDDGAAALAAGTFRDGLRSLSLVQAEIGARGVAAIAASFSNLASLDLKWNQLKDGGIRALAQASFARSLRYLRLQGASGLSGPALAALGKSELFEHLVSLDLVACKLGNGASDLFAAGAPRLARLRADSADRGVALALGPLRVLRELWLEQCAFGDAGADTLAKSGVLERLELLRLAGNGLSDRGLRTLLSAAMPRLRDLAVSGNRVGSDSTRALADAELPALERLCVGDIQAAGAQLFAKRPRPRLAALTLEWFMGQEDAAAALAALEAPIVELDIHYRSLAAPAARRLVSAWAPALYKLRLFYTGSGAEVATAIADTPLPALRDLDLAGNRIGPEGAAAIAAASFAPRLESLLLRSTEIGPAGARALARGSFSSLSRLDVAFSAAIEDEGALALAQSVGLPKLRRLDARGAGVGRAGATALAGSTTLRSLREVDVGPLEASALSGVLAAAPAGRLVATGAAQRTDGGVDAACAKYAAG